jgi:asparagine synthase (glutamine-hydrolysing)
MSWVIINKNDELNLNVDDNFQRIDTLNYSFFFDYENRFIEDKTFTNTDESVILVDGILLNKIELYNKYKSDNLHSCISNMYKENGISMIKNFRGPFTGSYYDKKNEVLYAFANQTGDTHVFYYSFGNLYIVSNDFKLIHNILLNNQIDYSLDIEASKEMLEFGYLVTDVTFNNKIKRLQPGNYLHIKNYQISFHEYFDIDNINTLDISLDEAIEIVDKNFRKAVKMCFDKDLEYGYESHLVDISGGLDSRMVNWVAKDLGYKNIVNISYSQSESDELKISSQMAKELDNKFIHMQLDDISFLYNPDEIIEKNYGLANYSGITGGNDLLKVLDFSVFGLEHTGQLGDVIIGSYEESNIHKKTDFSKKRISNQFHNIKIEDQNFPNQEYYLFKTRGMQGILSTHLTRRNYTEVVSPFIDVDFLKACFSIPLKYRSKHLLYFRWIEKKYPDALKIKTTRIRNYSTFYKNTNYFKMVIERLFYELKKILNNFNIISKISPPRYSMNPYRYWFNTNIKLKNFINKYFYENIINIKNNELKSYLTDAFYSKNFYRIINVITVLSVNKVYFNKDIK